MDYIKLIEAVRIETEKSVKKSRYEHSVRVAQMCARLCRFYNLDESKGYLAGIGHDMCKDLPESEMIEMAMEDGNPISDFERNRPKLLHGRAAAVKMQKIFGIKDKDILEAVANHTSGVLGMCDLTKCLFIADKIEPGRPHSTEEYIERLFKLSLNEMFFTVFEESYNYIINKGYELYPGTTQMLDFYKSEIKENQ